MNIEELFRALSTEDKLDYIYRLLVRSLNEEDKKEQYKNMLKTWQARYRDAEMV